MRSSLNPESQLAVLFLLNDEKMPKNQRITELGVLEGVLYEGVISI